MIELNIYGIILIMCLLIPKLLLIIFKPIKRVPHKIHKQMTILKKIGDYGVTIFSVISLFGYGYKPYNNIVYAIWIILMVLLFIFYYILYIRYLIKGRKEERLYDKVITYCPIVKIKFLILFLSSIMLFNPYIIVFSILLFISEYYLDYKKNFEWGIYEWNVFI